MSRRYPDTKPLYDTAHAKAASEAGGVLVYGPQFVDMPTDGTWYIVASTGIVHGVYGSALKEHAEAFAEKVPLAYVLEHKGARPKVGDHIWSIYNE
jgi:hypothetical protein